MSREPEEILSMPSSVPSPSQADPNRGLPPVVPPSGKFIAQLFLVPGMIVTLAVLLLLGFSWLAGGSRSPDRLLQNLKDPNPDVKWRAAHDLAQVLLRDDQLASEPQFALELADQTRQALADNQENERRLAELARKPDSEAEQRALKKVVEAERSSIQYLSACLANLALPVGAPLLSELATGGAGLSADVQALRHRQGAWALANLGANVRRFDKLPEERRQAVLEALQHASEQPGRDRADWARAACTYLAQTPPRSLQPLGMADTLLRCSADPDPFVREVAAFALNFWQGNAEESARLEATLRKLTYDDGHGEETLAALRQAEEGTDQSVTRIPGLKVRYNAAVALARRGSDQVRLDLLQEMLDEEAQRENFRVKRQAGPDTPDEAPARAAVLGALQAVAELHQKRPQLDLAALRPAVERLAHSGAPAVRAEAERTLIVLGNKSTE